LGSQKFELTRAALSFDTIVIKQLGHWQLIFELAWPKCNALLKPTLSLTGGIYTADPLPHPREHSANPLPYPHSMEYSADNLG